MDEETSGIKISEFPDAPSINNSDVVTGLHDNDNANFTFARIMAWLRAAVADFFVPNSRKVNNKALSADIALTASDVGARENDWMPTAAQVGARPDTWVPTAAQVGAVPVEAVGVAGGVPNLNEIGHVPASQLPPYPTFPSASIANPQMDGTPSPGSTGEWADGGHTHPTDTTRAAATLKINGHPLMGDFDLTAADVGAAPAKTALRFTSVAVSAGTAQQILAITDATITADYVLARIEWADPSYITAGYTWTTGAGSFILSGTATAATTANVVLIRKGN